MMEDSTRRAFIIRPLLRLPIGVEINTNGTLSRSSSPDFSLSALYVARELKSAETRTLLSRRTRALVEWVLRSPFSRVFHSTSKSAHEARCFRVLGILVSRVRAARAKFALPESCFDSRQQRDLIVALEKGSAG